jgi:hypothetical protein
MFTRKQVEALLEEERSKKNLPATNPYPAPPYTFKDSARSKSSMPRDDPPLGRPPNFG